MEIAGILTFLGLVIAAYSLLKPFERLLIKFRLSIIEKILLPILLICVFFAIVVSDYFKSTHKEVLILFKRIELSYIISVSAYLLLVLLTLYVYLKIKYSHLKRHRISTFNNLTKELIYKKEYQVLIELLNHEYAKLIKYSLSISISNSIKKNLLRLLPLKNDFVITPELVEMASGYAKECELELENEGQTERKAKLFAQSIKRSIKHYLGKFLRSIYHDVRDKYQDQALYIIHSVLSNVEFVSEMIAIKPELGLEIFKRDIHYLNDYADEYFYQLIRNRTSLLYYEIRNNNNISLRRRYIIPEENIILCYLFRDCRVAQRLEVYRGVGEYIINYLRELRAQKNDPNNYEFSDERREKWGSPIYVGIRFFDIMISEATYQGINSHMFLFYFRDFVDNILKNCRYDPVIRKEITAFEWRAKYRYYLDEIVHTLCEWIRAITEDDIGNKELINDDYDLGGGNSQIKASIVCLVQILERISRDERMPLRLKLPYADRVLQLLYELKTDDSETVNKYGGVIYNGIKFYMRWPFKELNYLFFEIISSAYEKFDKIPFTLGDGAEKGSLLDDNLKEYLSSLASEAL